jgi:hypothetical protein
VFALHRASQIACGFAQEFERVRAFRRCLSQVPFAGAFRGRKPRRLIAPGSIRRTRAGTVKCSSSATTRMGDFLHFLCEVGASISDLRHARPSSLSARDGISRMSLELSPMASEKPNCRAGAPHRSRGRAAPRGDKPVGTPGCGRHVCTFETATMRVRWVKKRHSRDAPVVGCDGAQGSSPGRHSCSRPNRVCRLQLEFPVACATEEGWVSPHRRGNRRTGYRRKVHQRPRVEHRAQTP